MLVGHDAPLPSHLDIISKIELAVKEELHNSLKVLFSPQ